MAKGIKRLQAHVDPPILPASASSTVWDTLENIDWLLNKVGRRIYNIGSCALFGWLMAAVAIARIHAHAAPSHLDF